MSKTQKKNDILDEAERFNGPRTCPGCGFQLPFKKLMGRYVMTYGSSTWSCQSCGEFVKCDFIKIQFLWLIGLVPFGFLFGVLMSNYDLGLFNVIFGFPFFAYAFLTFYFAKFEAPK